MEQRGSLAVEFRQSHRYSFTMPITGGFRLRLIPVEAPSTVTGLHYIFVVDVSGSMEGEKLEAAKEAAERLIDRVPSGNHISLIVFGTSGGGVEVLAEHVDTSNKEALKDTIRALEAENGTPLLRALLAAINVAARHGEPAYLILLSDGQPTDGSSLEDYKRLEIPENTKPVVIGIGLDYNKEILHTIAERGNGIFEHISETSIDELIEKIGSVAAEKGYAKDLRITLEPAPEIEARLIGYNSNEVNIPVVKDEDVSIYGEVKIPPGYRGTLAAIRVAYLDLATGQRVEQSFNYTVEPAPSREEFLKGIDKQILNEVMYYSYMNDVQRLIARGDLAGATRRIKAAEELAAKTRKIDLVAQTRTIKTLLTKTQKIRDPKELEETTRKLLSETTKTIRRT